MKLKFLYFFEVIFVTTFILKLNMTAESDSIVSFSFTDFKTCVTVTELNFLTAFTKVSIAQCANECENRPDCRALNYHRLFKMCELLSSDNGVLTNNKQKGPCVLMTKPHVTTFQLCSCTTGEVCSGPICETKECPKLSEKANTKVVGNLNSLGSRVLLGCSPGYVNTGEEYAVCLPNGTWDHQPFCVVDCGKPQAAIGANISYTETTEDSTVAYTCGSGYTHTGGDLVHVCASSGLWVGTLPTCAINCGQPQTAIGATISYTKTTENSTVAYTCVSGYTHTGGDLVHVCASSGLWVGTLPTCTIDCGQPDTALSARISYTETTESSTVTYTCLSGYTHTGGDLVHVCASSGLWGGTLPTCTIDCGQPQTAISATISYTKTTEDSTVAYTCVSGYKHTGGDLVHVCASSGLWVGTLPTCTIDCGQPQTAFSATIAYTETTEDSTVAYTCVSGYKHTGGDLVHMCASSGLWVGTLPTCTIDCLEPPTVPSSVISSGNTYEGSQRTYTCDNGKYFYTGTNTTTTVCLSDGAWSNMGVICPSGVSSSQCPGCGILRDCADVQSLGATQTGTYVIYPAGSAITVRCDMDTSSGGWTVIQRRISESDFHKTWAEYKNGFGNVAENFWLGNDNIATLTSLGSYKIRFDMYDLDEVYAYAEYSSFSLSNETGSYTLTVGGYSGTAGDSFSSHSGMMFSTKDVDNDISSTTNCATYYSGAWWFTKCFNCNLNGIYGNTELGKGVNWAAFRGIEYSLPKAEMKIKRNQ